MAITNTGKDWLALRIGSNVPLPQFISIGSGSGAFNATGLFLYGEVDRKPFSTTDFTIKSQYGVTAAWNSIQMSGINLREIGIPVGSSSLSGAQPSNPSFEAALVSGTNWFWESGNALYTSGRGTFKTVGNSGVQLTWTGSNDAITSGTRSAFTQNVSVSGVDRITFDYYMMQLSNVFEGRVLYSGIVLGSIYAASGAGSGTQGVFLANIGSQFGTGSADLRLEFASFSGGSPIAGSHFIAFDNVKFFIGGSMIATEHFTSLTFDGSNELEVEMIFKMN